MAPLSKLARARATGQIQGAAHLRLSSLASEVAVAIGGARSDSVLSSLSQPTLDLLDDVSLIQLGLIGKHEPGMSSA
jgi:hypothetical protein